WLRSVIISELALFIMSLFITNLKIGHGCHFGGALTGFLIGPLVLRDFSAKKLKLKIKLALFGMVIVFAASTIMFNAFSHGYFPDRNSSELCVTHRNATETSF